MNDSVLFRESKRQREKETRAASFIMLTTPTRSWADHALQHSKLVPCHTHTHSHTHIHQTNIKTVCLLLCAPFKKKTLNLLSSAGSSGTHLFHTPTDVQSVCFKCFKTWHKIAHTHNRHGNKQHRHRGEGGKEADMRRAFKSTNKYVILMVLWHFHRMTCIKRLDIPESMCAHTHTKMRWNNMTANQRRTHILIRTQTFSQFAKYALLTWSLGFVHFDFANLIALNGFSVLLIEHTSRTTMQTEKEFVIRIWSENCFRRTNYSANGGIFSWKCIEHSELSAIFAHLREIFPRSNCPSPSKHPTSFVRFCWSNSMFHKYLSANRSQISQTFVKSFESIHWKGLG